MLIAHSERDRNHSWPLPRYLIRAVFKLGLQTQHVSAFNKNLIAEGNEREEDSFRTKAAHIYIIYGHTEDDIILKTELRPVHNKKHGRQSREDQGRFLTFSAISSQVVLRKSTQRASNIRG